MIAPKKAFVIVRQPPPVKLPAPVNILDSGFIYDPSSSSDITKRPWFADLQQRNELERARKRRGK